MQHCHLLLQSHHYISLTAKQSPITSIFPHGFSQNPHIFAFCIAFIVKTNDKKQQQASDFYYCMMLCKHAKCCECCGHVPVYLSVRPSVTSQYCTKKSKHGITEIMVHDRHYYRPLIKVKVKASHTRY